MSLPVGIPAVDREQGDVRTELTHGPDQALVAERVAGVVEPDAVELGDVADEPRRPVRMTAEGVAVLDPDGMTGGNRCDANVPDLELDADPPANDPAAGDPGLGDAAHQRLRHDEDGLRGGRGDHGPGRQVEVVAVLVGCQHGGDADQGARIDRCGDNPIRAWREERIDQHEVVAAQEGEPGLPEGDDPDRAPRGAPGRQTSVGDRGRGHGVGSGATALASPPASST